jgi:transposase InsO family protein
VVEPDGFAFVEDRYIEHLLTAPRGPTATGEIERFHRSLRTEFRSAHTPFTNLKSAQ